MEKNMQVNFNYLEKRVLDALDKTDLEYIRSELKKINSPTVMCGVGGSSVVSDFATKILREKNEIITVNSEPRDFVYNCFSGFANVISCSYGGNNYGVELAFNNKLKKYLFSNNKFNDEKVTYLKYNTTIDKERSFISLGATLIPVTIMLNYYLDGDNEQIYDNLNSYNYDFKLPQHAYEIFTGIDTSTTSKYLESTLVESGSGIPIIHDKYSFCHGRSTTGINFSNTAIYLNRGTKFDKMLLEELKKYYSDVVVLSSVTTDQIVDDYQMLIQAMYLTKYIAEKSNKDLSKIEYSPIVLKTYEYKGEL